MKNTERMPQARARMTCTFYSRRARAPANLSRFVDPRRLDRLEDLFSAALGIVAEFRQRHDPLVKVHKVHCLGVLVGMRVGERHRDVLRVGPFHGFFPPTSRSLLMVYFGISITRSSSATLA